MRRPHTTTLIVRQARCLSASRLTREPLRVVKCVAQALTSLSVCFTVALGIVFLILQAEEYIVAYNDMGLTLNTGIYGSTFFLLTGFHGFHVTLGTVILLIQFLRAIRDHFEPDDCFGFEAASWYWHFVDVVWVGLFIFVYVL